MDEDGKSLDHDIINVGQSLSTINVDNVLERIQDIIDSDFTLLSSDVEGELKFDADDEVDQVFTIVFKRNKYKVTFVDGVGNELKIEEVIKHGSATAPNNPERKGYLFDGWDIEFDDVVEDITVTAKWVKEPAKVVKKDKPKVVNTSDRLHINGYLICLSLASVITMALSIIRIKFRGEKQAK